MTELRFTTTYLTAASVNASYSEYVQANGGTAPYAYSVTSGTLPTGLNFESNGHISGIATQTGIYNFIVKVVDANQSTFSAPFSFTVMTMVTLNDITVDQAQFVSQFQDVLGQTQTWSTGLTTQTSQTLIDLISSVGTFATARITRSKEDSFPETTQSDSAIRAIATMQGLRLSRKLPATILVTLSSTESQTLAPYTQFSGAGYSWFNTDQIVVFAGIEKTVILKEGVVQSYVLNGLGTDLQAWLSTQDNFSVSDQDVQVSINGATINKTFGGLWNYFNLSGFADLTLNDGRMLLQFGSQLYGSVPKVNDTIRITYAVTQGETINSAITQNTNVSVSGITTLSGNITSNPSGGANEKNPVVYKNFSSGTFGTYGSAITKSQYQALVNNYPGIVDAVTQSQREIDPSDPRWMNVIRVSALTNSEWGQTQIADFVDYMQSVTMYTNRFVYQAPVALARDVDISVYCFNSVNSTSAVTELVKAAITKLFSARPGALMTNLYESDLVNTAMNAAPGQISYVIINKPTSPMIVTAPLAPTLTYDVISSGGSLTSMSYYYGISVDTLSPSGDGTTELGYPSSWIFPQVKVKNSKVILTWPQTAATNLVGYKVWGRKANQIGVLASLGPTVLTFTDLGTTTPTPTSYRNLLIRYNTLNSLVVTTDYSDRQSNINFPIRDVVS